MIGRLLQNFKLSENVPRPPVFGAHGSVVKVTQTELPATQIYGTKPETLGEFSVLDLQHPINSDLRPLLAVKLRLGPSSTREDRNRHRQLLYVSMIHISVGNVSFCPYVWKPDQDSGSRLHDTLYHVA